MKVSFQLDGNTVTATGRVTNAGYVAIERISIRDENDEPVMNLERNYIELVKELSEEALYEKKFNKELEF